MDGGTSHYGRQTRSNDVRRDMPSPPLDSRHGRTTSGRACYHRLWTAHTVKRRRAWHDITSFGQHTRSNDVGRDMPSPPLDSTLGRTTSGLACHHRRWAANPDERCWAWNNITAFGQHTQSNDVGRDMPSPPLDNTQGRMTSCVACHHHLWAAHTVELRRKWHAIISFGKHEW